ncbi:cysteine desulfurase [Pseudonocardiaceae bacterium YIM PH 21723]|nr:cysteine desulfurase [Pseudonocardiaceae bacterium YIM PH 21723]
MTYLDHAATTPMLPEAVAAMTEALAELGNASSLHSSGRRARRRVEEAREDIADLVGARPSEVIFTAGGTESDNLALKGIYWARAARGKKRIVVSAVEHHAVLDAVQWLGEQGADITVLPPDALGRITPQTLAEHLGDDVALISVMLANNEVGTINPLRELAVTSGDIPLHSDAVQALGTLDVNFADLGADALTLSAHKIGGPYGAGILLLGRDVPCVPLLHGGGQERDVRSGTLDVPSVIGMATALRIAVTERDRRVAELIRLRDRLIAGVRAVVPDAVLNGDPEARLANNAHFSFPGCEGDGLLMLLDAKGIECSTGSACTAGIAQPSHVLLAMGADPAMARGSLRFSLGHTTTDEDIDAVLAVIGPVVERARSAGLVGARRGEGR